MGSRWSETRHKNEFRSRYHDDNVYQTRNKGYGERFQSHSDRIMRRRDERPSGNRYGGSRYHRGPYDRKEELTWREKKLDKPLVKDRITAYGQGGNRRLASTIVTPSHQLPPQEENITF
ncbi:BnaC06g09950D [Brassica napus]|uniref:BnaC06g09950D protein n=1 Tax=Brassica napus TaxID=3708 RepID=A0A078I7S5_BRANA|nr:BnaC06g09950D [Brassica napus]